MGTLLNNLGKNDNLIISIFNITPDDSGLLWLCTDGGLLLFDPVSKKVKSKYGSDQEGGFYLPSKSYYYIHIDKDNTHWLGTNSGLIKWDGPQTNDGTLSTYSKRKYKLFNKSGNLSNNVIYAILEDDNNRLWLSSDYGLMSFDKETYNVQIYLEKDGVSQNEFNKISYFKAYDGTMFFGGLNGVTYFHPKDFVKREDNYSQLLISDFTYLMVTKKSL